ncbi:17413_t:CDS:2 [Funneliformis geosporum]|uniref:14728_t:CDS:1 n=1 Tax=Funneliformis geosporum TaxID=1117311 RepID=A0A9W4X074_9GLOM|nr:14728_t:CDS:2 [Funneliformis geosporum]CAI2185687.1 17413_t:CDS:2 [Funneliformis geosporum]
MSKSLRGIEYVTCISDNEPIDVSLSVLVAFGLLISCVPQVSRIIKYRSSEGISPCPPTRKSIEWRNSIVIAIIITIHFIVTITITGVLLLFYGHEDINWMKGWADFLGVSSMIFVSIQFIPQLYKTWWRKSVGALSIPMMFMQVPASFIFVYTLYIRPGTRWTTWIVFFVSGCLQGILLIMCICWYYRSKRLGHGPFYISETDQLLGRNGKPLLPDERTRLINKGQKKRSPRPSTSRGSSFNSNASDPPIKDVTLNNDTNYLSVSS